MANPRKQSTKNNYRRRNHGRKPQTKSPLTPARRMAVEVTREVRQRSAYTRELIDSRREESTLEREEFAYAQVLCFGVAMCKGTLDWFIDRNLNSPSDIRDNVRDCLRISAYELLYLGKPDHVVADQGVEMVRYVASAAAGLGNAVLRKMVVDAKDFPWPAVGTGLDSFARLYGVPTWLASEFIIQHKRKVAASVLAACLAPAPTYVVDNPYLQGSTFAADLASQQVAAMVPVDGSVLEIGAGRGTKTMLLQRRAKLECGWSANIHTVDVHEYKEKLLAERLTAAHVPDVTTHSGDACELSAIKNLPRSFDAVFIDAPCSGTGTLRRHPEIRWSLAPEGVAELASLQLRMLKEAAGYVRPGGALVYATCSILRQENQEVVQAFLASEEGELFSIEPAQAHFPEFENAITEEGYFASLPQQDGPDGHFAVCLRRK